MSMRSWFYFFVLTTLGIVWCLYYVWPPVIYFLMLLVPIYVIGFYDVFQTQSNVLRNYPLIGHWRYILLSIRPQIHQYFVASDHSGRPFNKEMRDLVADRANKTKGVLPFGTQRDVDSTGYEWINHSMSPKRPNPERGRVLIGNEQCQQPYLASRLNISAMSFGALSMNAIRALNRGAKMGGFAHNTGEGGLSKYHLMEGGDLVWQIGTGYFGCRNADGGFDTELFRKKSAHEQVKMIEIKLSQGAKPAHGGLLPAAKVTKEIAEARHIPVGKTCDSPHKHSAFSTPIELLQFVRQLRDLSKGKPVGFKLCLGHRSDFMSICKAMLETNIYPDFMTIDGGEGGTGAAPVEFTDSIGTPLNDALVFVHNCLVGVNLRDHIKLIASAKIISGFDMVCKIALGADLCNSARGMMFSLGCIQSRRCHNNTCPTGIATQNPKLAYALNVDDKAVHVVNFHDGTIEAFLEVLGASGFDYPEQLLPTHIHRKLDGAKSSSYDEIYHFVAPGAILSGDINDVYQRHWDLANAHYFLSSDHVKLPNTYKRKIH